MFLPPWPPRRSGSPPAPAKKTTPSGMWAHHIAWMVVAGSVDATITFPLHMLSLWLQKPQPVRAQWQALSAQHIATGYAHYWQAKVATRFIGYGPFVVLQHHTQLSTSMLALVSSGMETVLTNAFVFKSRLALLNENRLTKGAFQESASGCSSVYRRFFFAFGAKNTINYMTIFHGRQYWGDDFLARGLFPGYAMPMATALSAALVQPFTSYWDVVMTKTMHQPLLAALQSAYALPWKQFRQVVMARGVMMGVGYGSVDAIARFGLP